MTATERSHPAAGQPRRRFGFTILEIVISLGILATGLAAVMAMFVHNARLAEMAREQVIQAILFGDLKSKQQMAALTQVDAGGHDTFDTNNWGLISPPATDNWPASKAKYDALVDAADPQYQYDNISTYAGFIFRVEQFKFVDEGQAKSPVFDKWRNQFTDWDGYEPSDSSWGLDASGNEDPTKYLGEQNVRLITEADINQDVNGDGVIDSDTPVGPAAVPAGPAGHYTLLGGGFRFGPAYPSNDLTFDPDGMRHYWKKLKCTLAWHLSMLDQPTQDQIFLNNQLSLARYRVFDFTIYNPDTNKD
ncbi:MAG: type IV pilus modification PilV family protein [Planctomycetota bacterium]